MTRGKVVTLSNAGFYLLLVIVMIILDPVASIGPCGFGSSMLIFFSFPFLAAGGLFVSLIVLAGGHRSAKGPAVVNGLVLIAFFLFLLALGWLH